MSASSRRRVKQGRGGMSDLETRVERLVRLADQVRDVGLSNRAKLDQAQALSADIAARVDRLRDDTRALLVEVRQYVMHHGLLIGECVAWNKLKEMHGVGEDQEADERWLADYRRKQREGK